MSAKTKIVVLRMKEIIYTAIFLGMGILLILLLFIMFHPKKTDAPASSDEVQHYIPGVYTSSLHMGNQEVDVSVSVDANRITGIEMIPLTDSVETMFPLVTPAMNSLTQQICQNQSTKNLSYPAEMRYTSQALIGCVEKALEKARIQ